MSNIKKQLEEKIAQAHLGGGEARIKNNMKNINLLQESV